MLTERRRFAYHSVVTEAYAVSTALPTTSDMSLSSTSKYPSRRAYVLKVRSDAKPGALVGRLENLVTGRQREFASGDELLQSIASDLRATARTTECERDDHSPRTGPKKG